MAKRKNRIHTITGEKGGVGKTTFGSGFVEYYCHKELAHTLIDVDETNPVTGLTYAPEQHRLDLPVGGDYDDADLTEEEKKRGAKNGGRIIFSDREEEFFIADKIYEAALTQDVILVLPSQIQPKYVRWITTNDLANSNSDVEIVNWFLCDGSAESLSMLKSSMTDLKGIKHILVKNLHFGSAASWKKFDSTYTSHLGDLVPEAVISLPKLCLPSKEIEMLRSEYVPLKDGIERVATLSKRRLRKFLDDTFAAIDETGLIARVVNQESKPAKPDKNQPAEQIPAAS
jgi:hypothetical protein